MYVCIYIYILQLILILPRQLWKRLDTDASGAITLMDFNRPIYIHVCVLYHYYYY